MYWVLNQIILNKRDKLTLQEPSIIYNITSSEACVLFYFFIFYFFHFDSIFLHLWYFIVKNDIIVIRVWKICIFVIWFKRRWHKFIKSSSLIWNVLFEYIYIFGWEVFVQLVVTSFNELDCGAWSMMSILWSIDYIIKCNFFLDFST